MLRRSFYPAGRGARQQALALSLAVLSNVGAPGGGKAARTHAVNAAVARGFGATR